MQHEDLRTDEQIFDDMLADDRTFEDIGARLAWSRHRVTRRYRQVCAELGEIPDAQ